MGNGTLSLLRGAGAFLSHSHFVYASGRHGDAYIRKDALYPDVDLIAGLCEAMIAPFRRSHIEVVVGPALGGILLSHLCARSLGEAVDRKVKSVFAEKDGHGNLVLRRGYDKFVRGRRVLVAEDILTTGGSAREVVEAVSQAGGEPVGVTAIVNRGEVTAKHLEVEELHALCAIHLPSWPPDECPFCEEGRPINTSVGHGAKFLEERKRT